MVVVMTVIIYITLLIKNSSKTKQTINQYTYPSYLPKKPQLNKKNPNKIHSEGDLDENYKKVC